MRFPSLLAAAWLVLAGCEDSTGPATGDATLHVLVTTTGGDIDLDGYQLRIDDRIGTPVDATADLTYVIRSGQHSLEFVGVAPNCTLTGDPHRRLTATIGETIQVRFEVSCQPTGVGITVNTTGPDPDPNGYQILVDGALNATITASGIKVVSRLEPGEHTVMLGGITPNCTLDGSPTRTLTVTNATITPAAFNLSCTATYGAVRIAVTTTGERPDNDYVVLLGTDPEFEPLGPEGWLPSTGAFVVAPVIGPYYVRLTDVAANCTVVGGPDRAVSVAVGGQVRDTALATFEVSCVAGDATVRISNTTSGSEAPTSFTVTMYLDGCTDPYYCSPYEVVTIPLAPNGVASSLLMSGTYTLRFDAGSTCRYEAAFYQTVDVPPGSTVDLEFDLLCERPILRVSAPTTGTNPDTEYSVTLWYYDFYYGSFATDLGSLAAGSTLETRLGYGGYLWVELAGVASNCTVTAANPAPAFTLDWGAVHEEVFPVTCGP